MLSSNLLAQTRFPFKREVRILKCRYADMFVYFQADALTLPPLVYAGRTSNPASSQCPYADCKYLSITR